MSGPGHPGPARVLRTGAAGVVAALLACTGQAAAPLAPAAIRPGPSADVTATPVPPDAAPPAPDAAPGYAGLGAESVRPEDVAAFAAPALPHEVAARISLALDQRAAGPGVLTDRADRMVFTWNVTGHNQVWRLDGPQRFPVQLTGGEDATLVMAVSRDGRHAVVSRDVGGGENPGLYWLPIDGGPLEVIQHRPKVQTSIGFISDDDQAVYYLANDRAPDAYALYRWDVATKTSSAVFTEPGLWRVLDHRRRRVLLGRALGNTNIEIFELDLDTGAATPRLGQGEGHYHDARYGQGDDLIVRTDKLGDLHRLYRWRAGALTPLGPSAPHEVSAFSIDEARRRVYVEHNQGGFAALSVLDAGTGRVLPTPGLPAARNRRIGPLSRDGQRVQVALDDGDRPPTTVVYDWAARRATAWRVPSAPELDLSRFVRATVEHYPARDGTKIPMLVRRPTRCAATPCPVVVEFHGGPESQSRPFFDPVGQLFVDAGFVLVEPNVRGSAGYGRTWLHADNGARRLEVITDIEDCARHLRAAFAEGGRAPRLGVFGGSYGGYSTLMAMTYFAGAFDAGVSSVGISNLVTFLDNTAPYRRILRTSEYGDPATDRAALVALSPTTHVDKLAAPLLIIQGLNDPRVPAGEAVQMYRAMQARGVPGRLILFPDEGHGTSKRGNRVLGLGHTLAFFEQHLLPPR